MCVVSDQLVPSCGVLWGVSASPAVLSTVEAIEKQVGRSFDLVYRYHDLHDTIPDAEEVAAVEQGRALHLAIAARLYDKPDLTVTYADIADGDYDPSLMKQAQGIASLKVPVFLTFEQEANQRRKLGARGSADDFKDAWRHLHALYEEAGVTNVVWTWVMTGAEENLERAGTMWPGNDQVDWISWNVYNGSGCNSGTVKPTKYQTFEEALTPFYDWVHSAGPGLGIDPSKPMMISEAGSVLYSNDLAKTADWYRQIPKVLPKYPQIQAITLWASSTSTACDYRFQSHPEVADAVSGMARSPLFRERIEIPAAP